MSRFAFPSAWMPALLVCAAALVSPSLASAQVKVAVVNFQKAVLGTADIKKASATLAAKYKPRQDQLLKLQQDIQEIQARLQDPKTPPASTQELQIEGTRRQREGTRLSEDLQAEAEKDRNAILQAAAVRMTEVVKKLAEEKGLDVVVDVSNTVFFKPALEVTDEAIAAYDKTYPAK